jgi:hypothetical protein
MAMAACPAAVANAQMVSLFVMLIGVAIQRIDHFNGILLDV